MKKKHLPKGFLSIKGKPTINAVVMFFIYLYFLPKDWKRDKVNLTAVKIVRYHFGVDYGFENMIRWGLNHRCHNSKTSSGRHNSMSEASVLARGLIGSGVELSSVLSMKRAA